MARSAMTGAVNRGAKVKREVTRRCPAREVLWGSRWQEPLAEQQPRHREVGWEGSCKQTPGPRNTKRIEASWRWVRGPKDPKPDAIRTEGAYMRRVYGRKVTRLTLGGLLIRHGG